MTSAAPPPDALIPSAPGTLALARDLKAYRGVVFIRGALLATALLAVGNAIFAICRELGVAIPASILWAILPILAVSALAARVATGGREVRLEHDPQRVLSAGGEAIARALIVRIDAREQMTITSTLDAWCVQAELRDGRLVTLLEACDEAQARQVAAQLNAAQPPVTDEAPSPAALLIRQDGDALEIVLPVSRRGKLEAAVSGVAALALLAWVLWSASGGLDLFDGLLGLAIFVLGGAQSYHRIAEDRLRITGNTWRLERRLLGVLPFGSITNADAPQRTLTLDPEAREWQVDGERYGYLSVQTPLRAHEAAADALASATRALPAPAAPRALTDEQP